MTERQFKKITKKLHFYNQGGIKNLCTMTATTLRQVMEEAAGVTQAYIRKLVQHDVDQQNKIALLSAKVYKLEKENAELKEKLGDIQMQKAGEKSDLVWKLKTANEQKTEQLTKAKEIIKEFVQVEYADFTNGDYSNELSKVLEQAAQFLKDQEEEPCGQ